jgi:hypothetical protein
MCPRRHSLRLSPLAIVIGGRQYPFPRIASSKPAMKPHTSGLSPPPERWRGIAGIPAELAKRIPGFADSGVDPDRIVAAIRAAGPEKGPATPGRAERIALIGEEPLERGDGPERAGATGQPEKALLEVFVLVLPRPLPAHSGSRRRGSLSPAQRSLYAGGALVHVQRRRGAWTSSPASRGDRAGSAGPVYGADRRRAERARNLPPRPTAAARAVSPRSPSTCPVAFSPAGERPALAALARIRADIRIDPARIGVSGLSFGRPFRGETPARQTCSQGGRSELRADPSRFLRRRTSRRCRSAWGSGALFRLIRWAIRSVRNEAPKPVAHCARSTSRARRGPLRMTSSCRFATSTNLEEQGVRQDSLIFADDRHRAGANRRLHEPFAVEWILRRLWA